MEVRFTNAMVFQKTLFGKRPKPFKSIITRQLSQPPVKYRLLNLKWFFYICILYYYASCGNSKKVNIGLLSHWPWVRVSPGSLENNTIILFRKALSHRWGFLFHILSYLIILYAKTGHKITGHTFNYVSLTQRKSFNPTQNDGGTGYGLVYMCQHSNR